MNDNEYNMYKGMLSTIDIGVFILDAEGTFLFVNEAYCRQTRQTKEFFSGMTVERLKEIQSITNSTYEVVMREQKTSSVILTVRTGQGKYRYDVLSTGFPLFEPKDDGSGETRIKYIFVVQELMEHLNRRVRQGTIFTSTLMSSPISSEDPMAVSGKIIAESPQMREILDLLNKVTKVDVPILINGPTGSGKEVIANYIHSISDRKDRPMYTLNCAAIPDTLIESELFGYEKGAFTGASNQGKVGLIEAADGGVLFLDEINSMPLMTQAKLLRVLESKQIIRVGSVKPRNVDFRLICAANESLADLVEKNLFRADLYFRINVINVDIPPLCERVDDILSLTIHYVMYFCNKYNCAKTLSKSVIDRFKAYSWPGNVRELRNTVERMIVTSPPSEFEISYIPKGLLEGPNALNDLGFEDGDQYDMFSDINEASRSPFIDIDDSFSYRSYMDECEKNMFEELLRQGKKPAEMAPILKIDLSNVYRKLKKYGLTV